MKELNELKRQNKFYIKENMDLKNKTIDLNNIFHHKVKKIY